MTDWKARALELWKSGEWRKDWHQLHPLLTCPAWAHLSFTVYAEPDLTVMSVQIANGYSPCP
jgi:hypothetical protein